MKRFYLVLIILCSLCIPSYSISKTLTGKVVSVADGDTITILDLSNRQRKIRLYGIDCPEKGQAFGKAAKKHTAKLTAKQKAKIKVYDTDRYGRSVGVVTVNGVNVNQSLIENGYAWQYRKYCKASFCRDWLLAEDMAQRVNMGLWQDKNPIPPWEWRKGNRNGGNKKLTKRAEPSVGGYHGNVKSNKFHAPDCRAYNCKNCVEVFKSREEAIAAGYEPCGLCKS